MAHEKEINNLIIDRTGEIFRRQPVCSTEEPIFQDRADQSRPDDIIIEECPNSCASSDQSFSVPGIFKNIVDALVGAVAEKISGHASEAIIQGAIKEAIPKSQEISAETYIAALTSGEENPSEPIINTNEGEEISLPTEDPSFSLSNNAPVPDLLGIALFTVGTEVGFLVFENGFDFGAPLPLQSNSDVTDETTLEGAFGLAFAQRRYGLKYAISGDLRSDGIDREKWHEGIGAYLTPLGGFDEPSGMAEFLKFYAGNQNLLDAGGDYDGQDLKIYADEPNLNKIEMIRNMWLRKIGFHNSPDMEETGAFNNHGIGFLSSPSFFFDSPGGGLGIGLAALAGLANDENDPSAQSFRVKDLVALAGGALMAMEFMSDKRNSGRLSFTDSADGSDSGNPSVVPNISGRGDEGDHSGHDHPDRGDSDLFPEPEELQ